MAAFLSGLPSLRVPSAETVRASADCTQVFRSDLPPAMTKSRLEEPSLECKMKLSGSNRGTFIVANGSHRPESKLYLRRERKRNSFYKHNCTKLQSANLSATFL